MLKVKQVYRAWIAINDTVIQSLALPHTVKITDKEVQATFRLTPKSCELSAIAIARKFRIEENAESTQLLEAKPSKRLGKLKDSDGNADFVLPPESLSSAIAYYLNDSNEKNGEGTAIEIVPRKSDVTSDDQIAVSRGGQIFVSENLSGKTIKVRTPIVYPRQVAILDDPLEVAIAHIICSWNDGGIKYIEITGKPISTGAVSPKNHLRTIKLSVENLRMEVLCST